MKRFYVGGEVAAMRYTDCLFITYEAYTERPERHLAVPTASSSLDAQFR